MNRTRLPIERGHVPRVPNDSQVSFSKRRQIQPLGAPSNRPAHAPPVSRIPRPVRTPVESPLLPALGSLHPSPPHDLVLARPPRPLHLALRLHRPRIARQQQLGILEERLGARNVRSLAVQLRAQPEVLDVRVFRGVLGRGRAGTERSGQGRVLRDGGERSVGGRASFGGGVLAGGWFLGLVSADVGLLFL